MDEDNVSSRQMSGDKPSSKWEQKQAAAKAAEAKFAANQKHAASQKHEKELGDLGNVEVVSKVGPLGRLIAHKAVLGIVVVLLIGGVIFGVCKIVKHQMRNAPGSPRGELFVSGVLVVIDHVELGGTDSKGRSQTATTKGQRLTAIDADTGKQLAVEVGDYESCWSGGGRVVCSDVSGRIEFLEPRTLATAATAADLIEKAKLAKPTRRYERVGDSVVVVLEDGRGALIDPTSLSVAPLATVQSSFTTPTSSGCPTDARFKTGPITLVFRSGTRNTLTSDPPPPAESPTPSGPSLSFLDGGFLRGPELPLVLHKQTMDRPEQLISRVDGISSETWSIPLGGECRRVWIHGPLLVVATANPKQRGVAIDLGSGRLAWTFGR